MSVIALEGQVKQAVEPADTEYAPIAHGVQVSLATKIVPKVPLSQMQSVTSSEPAGEEEFAAQARQSDMSLLPVVSAYVLLGQSPQPDEFAKPRVVEKVPMGQ